MILDAMSDVLCASVTLDYYWSQVKFIFNVALKSTTNQL